MASENLARHGHGPVMTNLLHRRSIVTRFEDKHRLQTCVLKIPGPSDRIHRWLTPLRFTHHCSDRSGAGLRGTQGAVRQRNEMSTAQISPAKVELQI